MKSRNVQLHTDWYFSAYSYSYTDVESLDNVISNHVTPVSDNSAQYARIDRLLDSNEIDKCTAFNELISQENLVCVLQFSFLQ